MAGLEDSTAIVTGAAQGLGEAFATALAGAGARVVCCDVDPVVEQVGARLGGVGVTADVAKLEDVKRVLDVALDGDSRLAILVNNAGRFSPTKLGGDLEQAALEFDRIVGTNLRGAFLFGRAVAAAFVEAGQGGHIINISTDHVLPPPGRPTGGGSAMDVYDASKWGLRGLTEAWARALRKRGVRVNELCMGATDTAMLRSLYPGPPPEEEVATWMAASDVARLLLELVNEGPEGRTGQQIGVWVGHEIALPDGAPSA
jgi:NAD(P)-dependent dehydrogenase (short-subunit alcohol dehydrogenase family)